MQLLFITSNRLGDAILSTGVLAHFLCQHPGAHVTVVCGKVPAPLFRALPGIAEIIAVEKAKFSTHWLSPFAHLFGKHWDLMIDLRQVGIMRLLPARAKLLGKDTKGTRHRVEDLAELLGGTARKVPTPTIWLDSEAVQTAKRLIPDGAPVIALGPTTGPKRKLWRPERYATVMGALTAPSGVMPGARIAVFGAPNERARADEVLRLLPSDRTLDLVGATDPLEAAAALGRCSLYVGADSGLMHLAAAMEVPTLGLFGEHGVPQIYRPWGVHTAFVHRRNPDWDVNNKPTAMDGIEANEVIQAAEELVRRAQTKV